MKRFNNARYGAGVLLFGLAILLAAGCSETVSQKSPEAKASDQAVVAVEVAQPSMQQAGKSQRMPIQNAGVVKTVQNAGAYSYLQVDVAGEAFWLATSATPVQPGQKISWRDFAPMKNFKSKTLGREFEQILFVDRIYSAQAGAGTVQQGVVKESLSAAGYSFIRVDRNGGSIWLAAPEISVDVGQNISWSGGSPMRNFTSRSLDRTFDEILFVGSVSRS